MSFLTIKDQSRNEIEALIKRALEFKNGAKANINALVANIFIEPSTRTQTSFQVAEDALGIKRYDLNIENSSFKKGETLEDTLLNLRVMGIHNFVIRTREEHYWEKFENKFNLINGGDGRQNHPSQALLDAITIFEHFKTLENLNVLVVGDLEFSRVYHSIKDLLEKFNSRVEGIDAQKDDKKLADYIKDKDVVIMLRIQHERHESKMDVSNYNNKFGLNKETLKLMKDNSIFMHPGPVNRGVEISEDILYKSEKSKILEQVNNGVFARMAILEKVCKNM